MLIPSVTVTVSRGEPSLSRRVNANSQPEWNKYSVQTKLIKKGEC